MGRIRGSNPRVKMNGLVGQGDPTRMKPVSYGPIEGGGSGRVGSGEEVFKSRWSRRVGPGDFQISRLGSSLQVFKSRGSGRSSQDTSPFSPVGSAQLIRPDPTCEV